MPFVRELGGEFAGFRGGSAYAQFVKEVGEAKTQVIQGEIDAPLFKSINDVLGIIFKLPSSAINRFMESLWKDSQGEDIDLIDYFVWRKKEE